MSKKWIAAVVSGVLLIVLVAVGVMAASVGSEASKLDTMLTADVNRHAPRADVKKQLADAGYTINQETQHIMATGPSHSVVVYSTHLTLDLGFDANDQLTSYHLERA